ncbi:HesA/MoeB/ThiF family protein [Rhodanobacter caeni]|uniref:Rhodanese domain-containing protein n=1 Tax=Rhodanobacter caeni TaxID=657654 RepID=A0ABP3EAA5_9GAMM
MNERYARQVALPEIGAAGQARLAAAHVLVIGAGGLGCPVLQYLAGAGIGRITVIDHDRVEESNLHRQPLYAMGDVGSFKAQAARAAVLRLNPAIAVEALPQRLTPANAATLVVGADIVVDAADSLAVTYTVSDACLQHHTPLISASAVGLSGYVGGFCGGAPSYRAVFPDMPTRAASCSSAGVLGSVVGIIGSLQAQCVLQLLLGIAPSPLGRLLRFDAGRLAFGGFEFHGASEPEGDALRFIDAGDVVPDDLVIDLRSLDEAPVSPLATALRFTAEQIDAFIATHPPAGRRVVLCCHSGVRAWRSARQLQSRGYARLALIALAETAA